MAGTIKESTLERKVTSDFGSNQDECSIERNKLTSKIKLTTLSKSPQQEQPVTQEPDVNIEAFLDAQAYEEDVSNPFQEIDDFLLDQ